jgi:leucyl-tRNA synthetase
MFRITAFAERLLADLDQLDWPESTRIQQAEWIGRSEGAEVDFPLAEAPNNPEKTIRVFTTRPDTLFGATFMVVAPEHPLIDEIRTHPRPETDVDALRDYVAQAKNRAEVDRMAETREKTGVFTGAYAINPTSGEPVPIWTADYVLMGYGHGAIMAVPAHDQRDFEFATKYGIPIVQVVEPIGEAYDPTAAFSGEGRNVNSMNDSVSLNGLPTDDAKRKITAWLEANGIGARQINYRLRDWLFSRQRYWGEPFPIVFDEAGNHYAIDESNLPVVLPEMDDYHPIESDEPMPLLAKATDWVNTTAGEAGVSPDVLPPDAPVKRETNTMPGWAGSCWYYLRFCDPRNDERFVSRASDQYWMNGHEATGGVGGVDLYIGGAEHAVLHLLYARFWHKLLYDLGEVSTPEPFRKLFHQGLITSFAYQRPNGSLVPTDQVEELSEDEFIETATGEKVTQVVAKMSKSLKNVINPDDVIHDYGADTFRLYEMYMGPLEASKPWNTRDIIGVHRFLQRVWRLVINEETGELDLAHKPDDGIERMLHRTIAKVGGDIERLAFNTAIAAMIEFVNEANKAGGLTANQLARFATILSPFAPHIAEELWSKLGHETPVSEAAWPEHDESMLTEDEIELPVQIMGKVRGKVSVPADADQKTVEDIALNDERIREQIAGKTVRKVIVVPGKIVNIVAN